MNIKGSHILVTGGSSGIGKATAQLLIKKGAKVIITGRNEGKLQEVAKHIGAIPIAFDVSELETIPAKAKEILDALDERLDVLVNNAGIGEFPLLGEIKAEDFQRVFSTNVFGLALLTQEFLPALKQQQSGTIINIGSTAAQKGFARGSVYAASKFAVRAMTQSWQAELRKENIRVCLVNPSEVTTAFAAEDRKEREEVNNKLGSEEIAHSIASVIEMRNKGFIPELTVWATNPF